MDMIQSLLSSIGLGEIDGAGALVLLLAVVGVLGVVSSLAGDSIEIFKDFKEFGYLSGLGPGGSGAKSCQARHILMKTEDELKKAKSRIEAGEAFAKVAAACSDCPSGRSAGGSLGEFSPGMMVPAFDRVCFDPETKIGELIGPVQTHFGFHLIIVDKRSGVDEADAAKTK
eukprot:TRINITY_DN101521_c0_g1_i1.p1 TRINITY_DN101521_c0_g1~~TRINITY_DN101521_c0_g1_i1.p1  ORF type:complete len:171 (-),score=34.58 TRINITY_DN101521_c0_g1_i1:128-640(-)